MRVLPFGVFRPYGHRRYRRQLYRNQNEGPTLRGISTGVTLNLINYKRLHQNEGPTLRGISTDLISSRYSPRVAIRMRVLPFGVFRRGPCTDFSWYMLLDQNEGPTLRGISTRTAAQVLFGLIAESE